MVDSVSVIVPRERVPSFHDCYSWVLTSAMMVIIYYSH